MSNEFGDVSNDSSIAIIGYSARFPGAKNIDEFWQNLRAGVESISVFADEELEAEGYTRSMLAHPACVKAGGILEDVDLFDASFFGYSPMEAALTDPQQRLFLECAWEALEHAGYDSDTYDGLIGVFGGVGRNAYLLNIYSHPSLVSSGVAQITIGNSSDYLTSRVSYKMNLKGPSVNVQTACSTSLVAIHMACQSILNAECNMALAGGLSLNIPQKSAFIYEEGGIISPDGHTRSYDARAKGIVGGSGGGMIVLKRLSDALADGDCVHAVIKGSAINNDGADKVGFTAPSVEGQAEVIAEALAVAGVKAETISYVEGHGTGTVMGDPIEVSALTQAFRLSTGKKEFCALGSVKSNFGHLDTGAGVAGLLKTTLALQHKSLVPSLNFNQPNPEIDFTNSPFYVNTRFTKWESHGSPRRAGVSSFGLGGTNAHVIVEEAPVYEREPKSKPWHLLVLSAKTSSALETATGNLSAHLNQHQDLDLDDVAYTLQLGRRAFDHRRTVVCRDLTEAIKALDSRDPQYVASHVHEPRERKVVFMFSGQGSQYLHAGRELYETETVFRTHLDRCAELLEPHLKSDLRAMLYPSAVEADEAAQKLNRTENTQPVLFALEYSLARLWMDWGVQPQAMIGHSIGEYVAACLAGVFTLEEALPLVAARGRLMQKLAGGAMLSVPLTAEEMRPLLGEGLSLAAVNAKSLCVVSGGAEAIDQLQERLKERGITSRRLQTSHAFHSGMMDPIMEPFAELIKKVNLREPHIPYVSNVTGNWITGTEATDPHYWVKHLRQTVLFAEGLRHFADDPKWIFLEIGPGNTLCSFAQRVKTDAHLALSSLRHPLQSTPDAAFMLNSLGRLWMAGVRIAWSKFNAGTTHYRVPLPTYPFERQRYWIERRNGGVTVDRSDDQLQPVNDDELAIGTSLHPRPAAANSYIAARTDLEHSVAAIWQERLGIAEIGVQDNFYELGGDSLLATQIVAQLREMFAIELSLNHFFDKQTIAGVAECIEEILVAEVSNLSDTQAQQLIQ
jgi:acyl transferase domain-containing protein